MIVGGPVAWRSSCRASTCSSSTSRSRPSAATTRHQPGCAVLGAERVHDRVRRGAGPAGRWADRVGRRRMFGAGLVGFSLGSALCGLAPGVRRADRRPVVQAVGAGLMVPTSLSLLLADRPGRRPRQGDRHLVGARRAGRRARAGYRRQSGPGQLALGVLGQPAGRLVAVLLRRAGRAGEQGPARPRPPRPGRRRAPRPRRRPGRAGPGQGARTGAGARPRFLGLLAAVGRVRRGVMILGVRAATTRP